jgi:hypothetical protein
MGVLANGMLAASTWLTVLLKKPFTLDYARAHVDRSLWSDPQFIRTNVVITSAWGLAFTVNTLLAWGKMERLIVPDAAYEVMAYSLLVGAAAFSSWYPKHARHRREVAPARPVALMDLVTYQCHDVNRQN